MTIVDPKETTITTTINTENPLQPPTDPPSVTPSSSASNTETIHAPETKTVTTEETIVIVGDPAGAEVRNNEKKHLPGTVTTEETILIVGNPASAEVPNNTTLETTKQVSETVIFVGKPVTLSGITLSSKTENQNTSSMSIVQHHDVEATSTVNMTPAEISLSESPVAFNHTEEDDDYEGVTGAQSEAAVANINDIDLTLDIKAGQATEVVQVSETTTVHVNATSPQSPTFNDSQL